MSQSRSSRSGTGLAAQLTRSAPEVKMYQALVIFGLQEDFLSPDGPLPVDTTTGFVDRILSLVPKFRDRAGLVMWVRAESAADVAADKLPGTEKSAKKFFQALDKELDRTAGGSMENPFQKYDTSPFTTAVQEQVSKADIIVDKKHCSAYSNPGFQITMHTNLIGDVYVCGSISEIDVYAFVRDAASKALKVHIIEDCLGYRNRSRNDHAVRRMVKEMAAKKITSVDIHKELDEPLKQTADADELADILGDKMKVDGEPEPEPPKQDVVRPSRKDIMLPSGILKKQPSTTKIYTRKSRKPISSSSQPPSAPESPAPPTPSASAPPSTEV
ncbi:Isochorismatase hydrolase [Microthyrium microscopicum]|uniref:Isochorismatase hydrolase n=1 Tax=Microthyrium microscopicum TaxID=703497 RepID=A0A6A6UPD1_9PEZI|nr:Isochorismatase hydrolase [Microthyrium microscopicum]